MSSCSICYELRYSQDVRLERLKESVEAGCAGCSVVRDTVIIFQPERKLTSGGWSGRMVYDQRIWPNPTLVIQLERGSLKDTSLKVDLFYLLSEQSGTRPYFESVGRATDISGDTGSDLSFVRALEWLENCKERHICQQETTTPLPKRVLDLGSPGSKEQVKLYESAGVTERYCCLSYCWGTAPSLIMTSATLEQHKKGIPWECIPKTYRDSIIIVRKLGVRYLWIDSLCIIQDDKEDWHIEASKMTQIYRNSYLTIACSAYSGDTHGCFSIASPEHRARKLTGKDRHGKPYTVQIRRSLTHEFDMPLLTRGWCFQERLLSPRVLHFGREELIWECMDQTTCECSSIDESSTTWAMKSMMKTALRKPGDTVQGTWYWMVQEYTKLNLTVESDIFPALSGAVNHLGVGRYVAGLWEGTLIADLLWTTRLRGKRPKTWRAPTWSWASVTTNVHYPIRTARGLATVESFITNMGVHCVPVGPDPAGELKSASLTLSGVLLPALLHWKHPFRSQEKTNYYTKFSEGRQLEFDPDYELALKGDHHLPRGTTVYCLRTAQTRPNNNIPNEGLYLYSEIWLILKCVDSTRQIYERIGYLNQDCSIGNRIFNPFKDMDIPRTFKVKETLKPTPNPFAKIFMLI